MTELQVELTLEQGLAFEKFKSGQSMCITGPGGCGKSTLIKYLKEYCHNEDKNVSVTAMTGVAGSLINGQTLHRWAGIGLAKHDARTIAHRIIRTRPDARKRWQTVEVLIIDEVSMLSAELFIKLNKIAQIIRNSMSFYGGIQVVFSGDFAQLEPIKADKMCFESELWKQYVHKNTFYMKTVLRQNENDFVKILLELRLGIISPQAKKILQERIVSDSSIGDIIIEGEKERVKPTMLYPYKKDVETINNKEINSLIKTGVESHCYNSADTQVDKKTGDTKELNRVEAELLDNASSAVSSLTLCIGAQVMLIKNLDMEKGLVNGSRGVITKLEPLPTVVFDNGEEVLIERTTFEVDSGKYIMKRLQYPLILAWALTIHKCQGSTLTNVVTDLSKVFCNAQAYVTLSRVRSLEGLFLLGINFSRIKCNPKVKKYYELL